MPRIRPADPRDPDVEILTRKKGDPRRRCFGFLQGIDGLTQVRWSAGCTEWVRMGDQYLVVWRKRKTRFVACSSCALEGYPHLVEPD